MFNDKIPQKIDGQDKENLIANEVNKEYEKVFNKSENGVKIMEGQNLGAQTKANASEVEKNLGQTTNLDIKDSDIHHMPDKFLKPEETKKKKNIFLILGIVLMVLIVISVGAFAFFALKDDGEKEVLNLDDDIITNDNSVDNLDPDAADLTTETGRDTQRINDILEIKSALSFYYNDVGKYPYYLT